MLTQVRDVSDDKAKAIIKAYPTFQSLWSPFRQARINGRDPGTILADIVVPSRKKNTHRRIGPCVSQRIYSCLAGDDPHEQINVK